MTTLPIDSRQLYIFNALAATGSFTKAARKLFMTQSGVSHAIKALETDLGCTLIRRHGRTISLTEAGEHLREEAFTILQLMFALRAELEDADRWGKGGGRLRLAASPKTCHFLLPGVLKEFQESFPQCRLEVMNAYTPEALEILRQGKADLAITLLPLKEEGFEHIPLFTDELKLIVPPGHPWAAHGTIEPAEIYSQHFILPNSNSYSIRMIRDYFKRAGLRMSSSVEMGNVEATKALIRAGVGIGVLATWMVREEVRRGELALVDLPEDHLRRDWVITHPCGRNLNVFEQTFVGLSEAFCRHNPELSR